MVFSSVAAACAGVAEPAATVVDATPMACCRLALPGYLIICIPFCLSRGRSRPAPRRLATLKSPCAAALCLGWPVRRSRTVGDAPGWTCRKISKILPQFNVSLAASRPLAWLDVKRLDVLNTPLTAQVLVVC